MKQKTITLAFLAFFCIAGWAQFELPPVPEVPQITQNTTIPEDSIFIRTQQDPMVYGAAFARCFTPCDINQDGIVTYGEAAQATELHLGYGGRKNIIGNYDFLRHFPNLVRLDVSNGTVEELDLTMLPKLEELDLRLALWVKRITLAKGCCPRIFYPDMEGDFTVTIAP